jgi:hypothetical protein
MKFNKFVIVGLPRSGSSMIVNTLNQLEDFNVYGEIFSKFSKNTQINHPQKIQFDMIKRNKINSFDLSKYNMVKDYLDNLYNGDRNTGFKLLYPNIKRSFGKQIIDYIINNNIYVIFLCRENKINQFVSKITNKKIGKVYIDPEELIKGVSILEKKESELSNMFTVINKKVIYEEITENKDIKLLNLNKLFPINREVEVTLRKYRSNNLFDNISNYNEVIKSIEKNAKYMIKWL